MTEYEFYRNTSPGLMMALYRNRYHKYLTFTEAEKELVELRFFFRSESKAGRTYDTVAALWQAFAQSNDRSAAKRDNFNMLTERNSND
ncbi:hypothetical protein [Candidatus Chlorohelix sp.]|uniref:hypothetical protein n=1 Tax=Candidatus Chlorohelix sp. TaxID=3139201 RepID=UPI00302D493A